MQVNVKLRWRTFQLYYSNSSTQSLINIEQASYMSNQWNHNSEEINRDIMISLKQD